MKFIKPIVSLVTVLFLPLSLVASNNTTIDNTPSSTHTSEDTQDNLVSVLTAVDDESTTAFINLDATALEQLGLDARTADEELASEIIEYAASHLGTPYRLGSNGPKSFDCSGFTSYVFKKFDIELSRTSRSQFMQGDKVDLTEIRPGDLMFFAGRRGGKTVGHVGMAVDVNEDGSIKFIHASTKKGVTYGTFPDDGYYSRRYLGARRVINGNI